MSGNRGELSSIVVTGIPLPHAHRERLESHFSTIHHFPNMKDIDPATLAEADVIYGNFPAKIVQRREQIPKTRIVQLSNAGSEDALESPLWSTEEGRIIPMATASGVHMRCIPQYFISTTLALYHKLQEQILFTQNRQRWGKWEEVTGARMFIRELRGKTVGILGYGHIGRESARLSQAFGAEVIVANASGRKKEQDGYIVPGTGDPDGSIPVEWYSTTDEASLASFLARTDVLLLALPSTPATRHMLSDRTLAHMKSSAVLVNVGRGDAIDTDALVVALDNGKLAGAVLDVTDPEPLPAGHTLFGRNNVIVTPHLSGRTESYFDLSLDIFLTNLARWKAGKKMINLVDPQRGY